MWCVEDGLTSPLHDKESKVILTLFHSQAKRSPSKAKMDCTSLQIEWDIFKCV